MGDFCHEFQAQWKHNFPSSNFFTYSQPQLFLAAENIQTQRVPSSVSSIVSHKGSLAAVFCMAEVPDIPVWILADHLALYV